MLGDVAALREVFKSIQAGDLTAAQRQLGPVPERSLPGMPLSEWWRMQAYLHVTAREQEAAQAAFTRGLAVLDPANPRAAGRFHYDYGAFLGEREHYPEALDEYVAARRYADQGRDKLTGLAVVYNLAWTCLQVGQFKQAARVLDGALSAMERPFGHSYRCLVHCGRALVAQVQGDYRLALTRAELARTTAPTPDLVARSLYLLAVAHAALGEPDQARTLMRRALETHGGGTFGQRVELMLALWNRDVLPSPLKEGRARIHLFKAAWALEAGDRTTAATELRAGQALANPFVLHQLAGLLPELYAWSHREGLGLPVIPAPSRDIRVNVRGDLALHVNGHRVHAFVPEGIPSVIAALAHGSESGVGLPAARVAREALGEQAARLEEVVARAQVLIGDQKAIDAYSNGEVPWLRLSPEWNWVIEDAGSGQVLRGLDSEVAQHYG